MHYFALAMKQVYDLLIVVPRWVLMLLSGALCNVIIRFLHKSDPEPAAKKVTEKKEEDKPSASSSAQPEASTTGAQSTPKGKGKLRKGGKK